MTCLHVHLFGAFSAALVADREAVFPSDKVRALLAYLAVESDQPHRREKLAGLLWPGYAESSARTNLRRALADLRRTIGDHQATRPYLHIRQETIQFNAASEARVDVAEFTRLLKIGKLEEAVSLYRAPFLEGFSLPDSPEFEEWALLTREQFHRHVLQALRRLTDVYQAQGEYEAALQHARRLVEMDAWQESAHQQVMQLLALSGQRGAALAQYEVFRQLVEELGVEPSEQTRQLYDLIRRGEWPPGAPVEAGLPTVEPRTVGPCPYRGLAAFRQQDATLFFGREAFVTRLAAAVCNRTAVTTVIGGSGSGKTSVVFAGLVPRLNDDATWLVVHFRPGARPFDALAAALSPWLVPRLSATDQLIETQKLGVRS